MTNKVSLELNATAAAEIVAKINELKALLPVGLVVLIDAEKSSLPKMGDKSLAFVLKCLDVAEQHPELCPPFVDVAEMRKDADAYQSLRSIERAFASVTAPLEDTMVLAGSEAYSAALSIYAMTKDGAKRGIAGAKELAAALAERFPGKSKQVTAVE
jgi:hypothetical protein